MRVAAYARYSSDNQRDASLDDQLRNCRQYAARQGWGAPVEYTDAAISGARNDRPGYLRLLAEASRYDVILVDDLTRLSRDSVTSTMATRKLAFRGVRIVGVSDGLDTGRKGYKAEVGLRGLMGELYLDDLREKTHRGLAGRALSGASAGGLPYGYRVAGTGERAIDDAQAQIVRRIFADYLAGKSPRAIASLLNADGVPSSRGGTWAMSAIYGDVKRGIGILANPIYIGRQVWNRSRWIKHPDTGRRVRRNRPQSEWITSEHPELAIIDSATWAATQRRLQASRAPATAPRGAGSGRPMKHLLSGLLRCAECGGPMVIVDRYRYGCGTHKDRGDAACRSRLRIPKAQAEAALLAGIQSDLLTDVAFERVKSAVRAALKRPVPNRDDARARLADAQRVHANIMQAIRAGIITPSTKAELERAEHDVQAAQDALRPSPATTMLPRLRERWDARARALADRARNLPAARQAIRDLLGDHLVVHNENGDLFAEIAASDCQLELVAGAGFEPATFGL